MVGPSPVPPAAVVPTLLPAAPVPRRIVLLLDDDPAVRKLLRRLLDREGYQVREASDTGAALRETGMDLAIVNLGVREEGEEAVRALKSAHPGLLVMVLSEALAPQETSEDVLILPRTPGVSAAMRQIRSLIPQDRQQLV